MSRPSPQMSTMQSALQQCGGEAALAKVLGVPAALLTSWLTAREALPADVYLKALGFVAAARRKAMAR